jgi:hypothetical protein
MMSTALVVCVGVDVPLDPHQVLGRANGTWPEALSGLGAKSGSGEADLELPGMARRVTAE